MSGHEGRIRLLFLMVLMTLCLAGGRATWAAQDDQTFYNQGQAGYDARDPDRSRNEAVADLKAEVLRQAVENLIDEDKLATRKNDIQSRIVKDPDRYVRSFQIVSQEVENGKLRVAGQVVVNVDELTHSLRDLGLIATPPAVAAVEGETAEEEDDQATVNDQNDTEDEQTAEEAAPPDEEEEPAGEESAGAIVQERLLAAQKNNRKKVVLLWWVAEKWEQASPWHVPGVGELGVAVHALFAGSIRQEMQTMPWTLVLSESGADVLVQEADGGRDIPLEQAKVQAQRQNADAVAVGTATQRRRPDGKVGLVADLSILDVASGDQLGEIHREVTLTQVENTVDVAEEIIKLAAWVAPELDRLVRAGVVGEHRADRVEGGRLDSAQEDRPETTKPAMKPDGPRPHGWTLMIHAFRGLGQWEQLEQALRQRFQGLEVKALELGAGTARIELDHVADNLPTILRELQLQTWRLEIQDENAVTRTIHLSIVPQGATQ